MARKTNTPTGADADADAGRSAQLTLGASKNGPQKRIGRPSDWTPAMADKFVQVLADSCNVSLAARAIRRSVANVYKQRSKDAAFRAAWDQALSVGYSRLELMMLERALHGTEKVIERRDGSIERMREYSNSLAVALLKLHRDLARDSEPPVYATPGSARPMCEAEVSEVRDKLARRLERLSKRLAGEDDGGECGAGAGT